MPRKIDQAEMHNGYVLTDRGGVMVGHGMDQDESRPTGYDTVSLLDKNEVDPMSPYVWNQTIAAD